jgi:hypothetical protein
MRFTTTLVAFVSTLTYMASATPTYGVNASSMPTTLITPGNTTLAPMSSPSCYMTSSGFVIMYRIKASAVADYKGVCRGLWNNLKTFRMACIPTHRYCGPDQLGGLEWEFNSAVFCNAHMVESAWWEATRNKFGVIQC